MLRFPHECNDDRESFLSVILTADSCFLIGNAGGLDDLDNFLGWLPPDILESSESWRELLPIDIWSAIVDMKWNELMGIYDSDSNVR